MAHLFTTAFTFREQTYSAVVTITGVDGSTTVNIFLPDPSLHQLLPGGKISFNAQEGLHLNYPKPSAAQDLLLAILTAVDAYYVQNQQAPKMQQH